MRIDLLIRALDIGGSQRQVRNLALGLKRIGHVPRILTYYPGGALAEGLAAAGIEIVPLARARTVLAPIALAFRLVRLMRGDPPDVVYAFLPSSTVLLAALAPLLPRSITTVWGLRAGFMPLARYGAKPRAIYRLQRMFRGSPDLAIANSESARDVLYRDGRVPVAVVPNAVDTNVFRPDPVAGKAFRSAIGVPSDAALVGFVGRADPVKNPDLFVEVAAMLLGRKADRYAAMVVPGDAASRTALAARIGASGVADRLVLLDAQEDLPAVYNALDVLVLTSIGESLPNVVLEALACGVPAVATDVGSVLKLVEEIGIGACAPEPSAAALADLVERYLDDPVRREEARSRAPAAIASRFGLEATASQTVTEIERLPRR